MYEFCSKKGELDYFRMRYHFRGYRFRQNLHSRKRASNTQPKFGWQKVPFLVNRYHFTTHLVLSTSTMDEKSLEGIYLVWTTFLEWVHSIRISMWIKQILWPITMCNLSMVTIRKRLTPRTDTGQLILYLAWFWYAYFRYVHLNEPKEILFHTIDLGYVSNISFQRATENSKQRHRKKHTEDSRSNWFANVTVECKGWRANENWYYLIWMDA